MRSARGAYAAVAQRPDVRATDVAVIIVTYRSAQLAVAALRSVAAERAAERAVGGLRIRAVVVDNASGDLAAIAAAVEHEDWSEWVSLVAAPRNGGFAYGNNLGIARARADALPDYLYLLNPDAQIHAGAIRALVDFLDEHPQVGIAGGSFQSLDGHEWPFAFRFPTWQSEVAAGMQLALVTRLLDRWVVARRMRGGPQPVDWVSGAALLVRAAALARVGGLDENYFLYFEETDLCYRARQLGYATWYVPHSRVAHSEGQSTGLGGTAGRRLPGYWFDSRRRYFARTAGLPQAMLIDVVAVLARSLGLAKRLVLGRRGTPHFIRDLLRHSVLWRRNRRIPPPSFGPLHAPTPDHPCGDHLSARQLLRLLLGAARAAHPGWSPRELKRRVGFIRRGFRHRAPLRQFCARLQATIGDGVLSAVDFAGVTSWPYVNNAWGVAERLDRIATNYEWLRSSPLPQLARVKETPLSLLDLSRVSADCHVLLDRPPWFKREGELVLELFKADLRVVSIAFLFGVESGAATIFIGAVQGIHGGISAESSLEIYRNLTKEFAGLRPRSLLLEILKMLGRALRIHRLLAIADENRHHRHRYFGAAEAAKLRTGYNEIWLEHGGTPSAVPGFYELSLDPNRRPASEIPARKRAMYRRRYALLEEIERELRERLAPR